MKCRKGIWGSVLLTSVVAAFPSVFTLTWNIETVDSTGDMNRWCSLALDDNGHPHIAYYDNMNHDLRYARYTGAEWHIELVDTTGDVGSGTSLALDNLGHPHITYYSMSGSTGILKYAHWNGFAWQIQEVDTTDVVVNWNCTSIALDTLHRPHVSYTSIGGDDLIVYTYWDGYGFGWIKEVVTGAGAALPYSDRYLALDRKGRPHITFIYYTLDMQHYTRYALRDSMGWTIKTVEDSLWLFCSAPSIALDSLDYPHISYTTGVLKYASWDGTNWQIEYVNGAVDWSSLALDHQCRPHVSYKAGGLKYALRKDAVWEIETIDSLVDPGYANSLALDSEGLPHIAYYDSYTGTLKYARGTVTGIEESIHIVEVSGCQLSRNRPNPFSNFTDVSYWVKDRCHITLSVYDISGRLVTNLEGRECKPGCFSVRWNGRDNSGRRVPSGPYFLRLEANMGLGTHTGQAGKYTATRKLCVVR